MTPVLPVHKQIFLSHFAGYLEFLMVFQNLYLSTISCGTFDNVLQDTGWELVAVAVEVSVVACVATAEFWLSSVVFT